MTRLVDEHGCDAIMIDSWWGGRGWISCGACGWKSPHQNLHDPSWCLILTWCEVHRHECPLEASLPSGVPESERS